MATPRRSAAACTRCAVRRAPSRHAGRPVHVEPTHLMSATNRRSRGSSSTKRLPGSRRRVNGCMGLGARPARLPCGDSAAGTLVSPKCSGGSRPYKRHHRQRRYRRVARPTLAAQPPDGQFGIGSRAFLSGSWSSCGRPPRESRSPSTRLRSGARCCPKLAEILADRASAFHLGRIGRLRALSCAPVASTSRILPAPARARDSGKAPQGPLDEVEREFRQLRDALDKTGSQALERCSLSPCWRPPRRSITARATLASRRSRGTASSSTLSSTSTNCLCVSGSKATIARDGTRPTSMIKAASVQKRERPGRRRESRRSGILPLCTGSMEAKANGASWYKDAGCLTEE